MTIKAPSYAWHLVGIIVCSIVAFFIWAITTGIAIGPVIQRSDEVPRASEASTSIVGFCGYIGDGMGYPFRWIPPQSILDGPPAYILMAFFWGTIFYFCVRAMFLIARRSS